MCTFISITPLINNQWPKQEPCGRYMYKCRFILAREKKSSWGGFQKKNFLLLMSIYFNKSILCDSINLNCLVYNVESFARVIKVNRLH